MLNKNLKVPRAKKFWVWRKDNYISDDDGDRDGDDDEVDSGGDDDGDGDDGGGIGDKIDGSDDEGDGGDGGDIDNGDGGCLKKIQGELTGIENKTPRFYNAFTYFVLTSSL